MYSGKLYKTKSNKELHGFLFNDFLLLTYLVRQFAASSGSEKLFSSKSSAQFKMYKTVSANPRRWDLSGSTLTCVSPPTCPALPWGPSPASGARCVLCSSKGRSPAATRAGFGFLLANTTLCHSHLCLCDWNHPARCQCAESRSQQQHRRSELVPSSVTLTWAWVFTSPSRLAFLLGHRPWAPGPSRVSTTRLF